MTISNTSRTAGPFIGNGITKDFPFSYKVFARSDVVVAQTATATGVESLKTLDADYTVTLNTDQDTNPGGIITMMVSPPVGTTLAATSNIAITQSLNLTNQGGFYPRVINDALDRVVIMIQQLSAKVGGGLGIGVAALLALMQAKLARIVSPADYGAKGDGIADDTAAVQAAINNGKLIRFDDYASYVISKPLVLPSKRKFIGNGSSLIAASQSLIAFFTANGLLVNDIEFKDLVFVGGGTFGGAGAAAKFSNANVGIYLNAGGSNWRIQDCKFSGMDRAATLIGGDQVAITGNQVLNNGIAGFSLSNVTNFEVANNIINGVLGDDNYPGNTYGKFGDGVYLDACVGGVVSNNRISRCVRIGICLESSSVNVNKNISITGNSITDLTNSRNTEANCGIWVEGGRSDGSITITGNTVRYLPTWAGQKAYGILCFNGGVVSGNYLYGTAQIPSAYGFGVQVGNGSTIVSDNHIEGFMCGIAATGPRAEDYLYNIKDNTVLRNTQYGIYILGLASFFDISGNIVKDNGADLALPANGFGGVGLQIMASGGYAPKVNLVNNSFISSASEGATKGQLYAIITAAGAGGLPKIYGLKTNAFIFTGAFATPYPNGSILPACIGYSTGGEIINFVRDVIGDIFGNTCTKAPGQDSIINSGSGNPRCLGVSNSIPSEAFPTTPSLIGDYYLNNTLATSGPERWICTGSGTPGTWEPFGVIGATRAAHVSTTNGATLVQLETNLNNLLLNLTAAKVMV